MLLVTSLIYANCYVRMRIAQRLSPFNQDSFPNITVKKKNSDHVQCAMKQSKSVW